MNLELLVQSLFRRTEFLLIAVSAIAWAVVGSDLAFGFQESGTAVAESAKDADQKDADKNDDSKDDDASAKEKSAAAKDDDAKEETASNDEDAESKADKDKSADETARNKAAAKSDDDSEKKRSASSAAKKSSASSKRDKVRLALLVLKDDLPETSGQMGLFGQSSIDLREAVSRLEKASKDKSISGVVLNIENPSIGRAKVEELRAAIARFRKAGKKVYAQLETGMPADYFIACACDEIVMPETGVLMLPGVHAEATFFKGLLGKLGVQADFIHIGAYKGAAEPFTREKFSDPVRENMTSLIDSMYDDMVTTIVKARPLSISQAKEVIDRGLITATKAKELGLIDRIAYSDTLRKELADSYEAESLVYVKNYGQKEVDTDFSGPMGLFKLMQAMMGGNPMRQHRPRQEDRGGVCRWPDHVRQK